MRPALSAVALLAQLALAQEPGHEAKRVAVVFVGGLRTWDLARASLYRSVVEPSDADVFFHVFPREPGDATDLAAARAELLALPRVVDAEVERWG